MKALVTGGTGFVGTHLVSHLADLGYDVTVLVRDRQKIPTAWKEKSNISILLFDIESFLKKESVEESYDIIYHFAWMGTSGVLRADESVQLENIRCTCEMVRYAGRHKVKRFVFAGSIMEYEAQKFVGGDRKYPAASNMYSIAKLTADYMAKTLCNALGIEYINVLISNIYGPGEKSDRFLNTMLKKMYNGEICELSEGLQLYDFIYIDDAVRAIELSGSKGTSGGEYYIGNPKQYSLKSFVLKMNNIVNKGTELKFGAIKSSGAFLDYSEFNTFKLEEELGFKAKVPFSDGVKNTYEWIIKGEV